MVGGKFFKESDVQALQNLIGIKNLSRVRTGNFNSHALQNLSDRSHSCAFYSDAICFFNIPYFHNNIR
ncbi:MAG: hypothetical protein ACD_67C00181G0001 [uncultured bacterium]|nr:MAG: hypothetical protein ACD_67C00181G0001 [uncultured bacterium]